MGSSGTSTAITGSANYTITDGEGNDVTGDATLTFSPSVNGLTYDAAAGVISYSGLALVGTTTTTATASYDGKTATASVVLDMHSEPVGPDTPEPDEPIPDPDPEPTNG